MTAAAVATQATRAAAIATFGGSSAAVATPDVDAHANAIVVVHVTAAIVAKDNAM